MEEYLQYMKTLRSQMNDVEDQAAKVSVEEQMQTTTIETMEKDLAHAKSETRKLKDDTDQMTRTKGQICSQILEKRRKISCMESDSSTLAQTLELIQQEKVSISAKLVAKRSYYTKVTEDTRTKLEEQKVYHGWYVYHIRTEAGQQGLNNQTRKNLMKLLDSAKAKLDQTKQKKSNLILENTKMRLSIEHVRRKANEFKPGLLSTDKKVLEEEYTALLSDKSGEMDYLCSLQSETEKLKGISYIGKCGCGVEKAGADLYP